MAEEREVPVGFRLPLYKSLTEQILMAGAPRKVVILNATLAACLILILHVWWIFPVHILIHIGSVYLTKKDDQFFDCFARYLNKKNYYST